MEQQRSAKKTSLVKRANATDVEPEKQHFLRLEKNLNSIGFFSTAKGGGVRSTETRTIEFKRTVDGKVYTAKVEILPSPKHGLPDTTDQDKYFAFMHLVNQIKLRDGVVRNPIRFHTYELLKILGMTNSGRSYDDITAWLRRMTATTIESEGAIYATRQKRFMTDSYHAFSRVVTVGQKDDDGSVAQCNIVYVENWLLDSFNSSFVFPIEMSGYRQLRSSLAKTLVPHLQIWLYGSRSRRRFEKRYSELCAVCGIENYPWLSRARQQLQQAMKELVKVGYIEHWDLAMTADGQDFKLVVTHGPKFFADQALLMGKVPAELEAPRPEGDEPPPVYQALIDRAVTPAVARKVAKEISDEQGRIVMDQIEYCDSIVAESKGKIANPPGLYIACLREDWPVPPTFISSAKAATMRMEQEIVERRDTEEWLIQEEYRAYVEQEVEAAYRALDADERTARVEELRKLVRKSCPKMPERALNEQVEYRFRKELYETLVLMTLDEFAYNRDPQMGLPFA